MEGSVLGDGKLGQPARPYQPPEVVVAVWVFPPVFNCCPVALLCCLEPFQAILNYAQIHPRGCKVWSGKAFFLKKKTKTKDKQKKGEDQMTALTQRSILCPWQKAKKRKKKMLTVFGQPMRAALRLPVAHSFLLRYSRGYSWHERTWDLIWKWREKPNRLLPLYCFLPTLRNQ